MLEDIYLIFSSTAIGTIRKFTCIRAEIPVYTPDSRDYIIIQNLNKSISDRFISFKTKTCKNAYVGLISGNTDNDPLYEIVIGEFWNTESYMRIGRAYSAPLLSVNLGHVLHCYSYTYFFITWNNTTITVGVRRNLNWYVFLTWTSSTNLWSIFNVGICTYGSTGQWQFYTSDIPTTSDEATGLWKTTTIGDLLIPTDVTRHPQITTANYLSTISDGKSTRPHTSTEILTMYGETTELPQTTRTDDMTTTSEDLQSRITNDDTAISDTSAASASSKSTTMTLKLMTTPSSMFISETAPCAGKCTSTCTCTFNCPKASTTASSNVLVNQLKIDKKALTSYKRRQQSATDPRKSSYYIGSKNIKKLKRQKVCIQERNIYISGIAYRMVIIKAERCFHYKDTTKATVLMHVCQAKADEDEIIKFVTFVLEEGAYIQLQDVFGKTALDYAQENGLTKVETLLRKTVYDDFVEGLSWLF
ncbi:unnamed protein product [Mytilus coruscus]|uniref:Farnesoic acid O-methyl transferase domain-containing protein n=1 Tax=Mytilus coruscus TaxID=42192 RepID=A0A6J8AE27_MYTCO|nr:unnamed protein product [Mytilus coruscus]